MGRFGEDFLWEYQDCQIRLSGGQVIGIRGHEFSQRGVPLKWAEMESSYPLQSQKAGDFRLFSCVHQPRPGIGMPENWPASIATKDGQNFSLFVEKLCEPDLTGPKPAETQPNRPDFDMTKIQNTVQLRTTRTDFDIEIFQNSNPAAASHFLNLVRTGFYNGLPFHHVFPGFAVEFGVNWRPPHNEWEYRDLEDDFGKPVEWRQVAGTVTLRSTTKISINIQDFSQYDFHWGWAIGRVAGGLSALELLQPSGTTTYGISEALLWKEGESYLASLADVPDRIIEATVMESSAPSK